MNKFILLGLVFFLSCGTPSTRKILDLALPKHYVINKAKEALIVDGLANEEAWEVLERKTKTSPGVPMERWIGG